MKLTGIMLAVFLMALSHEVTAQRVRGKVTDADGAPLSNVNILLQGTQRGTATNDRGAFNIEMSSSARTLIFSHVAYEPDTITVLGDTVLTITLNKARTTETVEVTGNRPSTYIANSAIKTEVVTDEELKNAPCCDLSGCFSTTSSVEVAVADVITDMRELRMIGLAGVYTQVLIDNTPWMMQGLNSSSGLNFIPGPLIDKMYIVKGANSVLHGYESISGQVNVLLKEGDETDALFANVFTNSFLEKQFNLHASQGFGLWSAVAAAHSVQQADRIDQDGNGFLDTPLITRYLLYNKWKYLDEEDGVSFRIALKYTDEDRVGGQRTYDPSRHRLSSSIYGQRLHAKRFEIYSKTEILYDEAERLNIHSGAARHRLASVFGTTQYDATQTSAFVDASYRLEIAAENALTFGASFRFLNIDEDVRFDFNLHNKTYDGLYETKESLPGVFVENTMELFDDRMTILTGLRYDYHSIHGSILTPRALMRYALDDFTTVRLTAGIGARSPYVLSENAALLASSRDLSFPADARLERAVNLGSSITHTFSFFEGSATATIDAFHTRFLKQLIADYDSSPERIAFRYLDNSSFSNNIVIELSMSASENFNSKIAWTFSEAFETGESIRRAIPFIEKHKVLISAKQRFGGSGFSLTGSLEWHGRQQLPDMASYPAELRMTSPSPDFTMINIQATHAWDWFELYGGIENILDFRQANPIINAARPFERYFEPTFAWGPVKGRELYLGLRAYLQTWSNE